MLFLSVVLFLTTGLLCYAGYIFLIVDRRQDTKMLENTELFEALDDKNYDFELPEQVDTYEELKLDEPADKRALPMALLERAKADIPLIEQLEKDHPRMARLFQKGLLPFGLWEQLLEAEAIMDGEVNSVQAEAERLQKGWGAGVFSQAYQLLRKDRDEKQREEALAREAAVLTLKFTQLSGTVVSMVADGRKVTQQTPLVLRKDSATTEVAFKSSVTAELVMGAGEEEKTYSCAVPELELDPKQEKQWKQIGSDATGLRLQVRFVRKETRFVIGDVRATVPESPKVIAVGDTQS